MTLTLEALVGLADVAKHNGTQDAYIDVALKWATQAEAEITRLQKIIEEMQEKSGE